METLRHVLFFFAIVFSLFSKTYCQCLGSTKTLSVGYIAISVSPPGYPNGYATNLQCSWLVSTSFPGKSVLFRVIDMTLNCAGDAINVYDGTSTNGTKIHTNECASGVSARTLGYQVAVTGNMYSVFTSDASSSVSEKGFKMFLISGGDFSGTGCSGTPQNLTAKITKQFLSSPGFPSSYQINKNCEWMIETTNSNTNVFIEIRFLDVEYEKTCSYDYLKILESGAVVDTLCRNDDFEPRENYTSTGQSFSVKFFADEYTTSKRGFLLSYVQTEARPSFIDDDATYKHYTGTGEKESTHKHPVPITKVEYTTDTETTYVQSTFSTKVQHTTDTETTHVQSTFSTKEKVEVRHTTETETTHLQSILITTLQSTPDKETTTEQPVPTIEIQHTSDMETTHAKSTYSTLLQTTPDKVTSNEDPTPTTKVRHTTDTETTHLQSILITTPQSTPDKETTTEQPVPTIEIQHTSDMETTHAKSTYSTHIQTTTEKGTTYRQETSTTIVPTTTERQIAHITMTSSTEFMRETSVQSTNGTDSTALTTKETSREHSTVSYDKSTYAESGISPGETREQPELKTSSSSSSKQTIDTTEILTLTTVAIGIGVGVGFIVLMILVVYYFLRRSRKNLNLPKEKYADVVAETSDVPNSDQLAPLNHGPIFINLGFNKLVAEYDLD